MRGAAADVDGKIPRKSMVMGQDVPTPLADHRPCRAAPCDSAISANEDVFRLISDLITVAIIVREERENFNNT